jgi:hypothetical protein
MMTIDRLQAPSFTSNFNFPEIAPDLHTLANKIPIYVINAG